MTNNKNCTKYYSNRQEKNIAKTLHGKLTPGSGCTDFIKGDVQVENILIEAKTCMEPKESFSIKKKWLTKLKEEMYAMNKDYRALCFDFGDNKDRYYIIDENTFKEFIFLMKD